MAADGMEAGFGRFGSGQKVRRIEDAALLSGTGRFTDDFSLPGQAHCVFLRSPHAHARITGIDTAAALAMPGVLAVITGAELAEAGVKPLGVALPFKRPDGSPLAAPPRTILATDMVRFAGMEGQDASIRHRARRRDGRRLCRAASAAARL